MTDAPSLFLNGSASFDGEVVFEHLELEVTGGSWTCLLGPSGVGKSTIVNLFAGLDNSVLFEGTIGTSSGILQNNVAMMAQSDLLLPWLSVKENVMLGSRLRGERPDQGRASAVLERVGLSGLNERKPSQLSGGQRQRVALARTLMEDRAVVLLDEPFSSLDARTRFQMQELAVEVFAGRTVLLVTHDPGEAARLGHVIKLMTRTGFIDVPPPQGDTPRPVDDENLLRVQAAMLRQLREDLS